MRTFSLSIRPGDIGEDFYRQARAQNAQYLSERLKDQAAFYAESDAQRADWQKGLQEGLSNWVDNASDYASQAAQLATEGISGMVNNITEMLNGNKWNGATGPHPYCRKSQKFL